MLKFTESMKLEMDARAVTHFDVLCRDMEFQHYGVTSTHNPSLAAVLVAICTISIDTN